MARPRGKPISDFTAKQARMLLARGMTAPAVADRLGISATSVRKFDTPAPRPLPRFELVSVAPIPEPERPLTAREVYALEKAKRAERLKHSAQMSDAKAEFARQLEAQRIAGKGGRPKKSPLQPIAVASRKQTPGKPMIVAVKNDPLDLLPYLGTFTGSGQ